MATERLVTNTVPQLFNHLHVLVLGSSLVVYNIPKIILGPGKRMRLNATWYYIFFAAGFVMIVTAFWWMTMNVITVSIVLGAFAFAYSLPLLPFRNKKRLREFGWLKIMVLASVWTIATSILPLLFLGKNTGDYPFEIVMRFAFIFTLCIVFDIRDMQSDLDNNINTLPHKVGIENSYRLINFTLVIFVVLSILQHLRYPQTGRLAGAILTSAITWLVVLYLKRRPSEKAYLLFADGVMLLYAVLILIP